MLRWRWGALLAIFLAGGAACSTDDGRFTVPSSPGREVVLVGERAGFDMRPAFLDHGELISGSIWIDRAPTLSPPFSTRRSAPATLRG